MAKILYTGSCLNCIYFGWEQPEDESSILKCAKCKMAFYCSRQCQEEHWLNVHKKHCRYLAGVKVMPKAKHDEVTCLVCDAEHKSGKKQMCKPDNPVLPCILAQANQAFMKTTMDIAALAFPVAEMSGKFLTKIDETASFMMRILTKLKMIKHTAWCIDTLSADELFQVLHEVRNLCWAAYIIILPDDGIRMNQTLMALIGSSTALEINRLVTKIDKQLLAVDFEDCNKLAPWDTLKVLSTLLLYSGVNTTRTIAECVGLPAISEDLKRIRVTAAQFNEIREGVLVKLQGGLLPFSSVLESLCGGSLEQFCYSCNCDITIGSVVNDLGLRSSNLGDGSFLVFLSSAILGLCDQTKCRKKCDEVVKEEKDLCFFYAQVGYEYAEDVCDNCNQFYLGGKVHRCSRCLTKVYCGKDCRDKAWPVHKLACRKGEEKRKMKGCKKERKMKGSEHMESRLAALDL